MKRTGTVLLLALLLSLVLAFSGCGTAKPDSGSAPNPSSASDSSSTPFEVKPSKPDGIIYDDLSENFVFIIYPTQLLIDDGRKNIQYNFEVVNQSDRDYKDFSASVVMNEALDPYLAAGAVPLSFKGVDVAAVNKKDLGTYECRGVSVSLQQLLSDEEFMKEAKLDYKEIEPLAKTFDLVLKWNGGTEQHSFTQAVINDLP